MRAYLVTYAGRRRYAGTQAEAKAGRVALLEEAGLGPRSSEVAITEVDVPTTKAELLAYLNEVEARANPVVPAIG